MRARRRTLSPPPLSLAAAATDDDCHERLCPSLTCFPPLSSFTLGKSLVQTHGHTFSRLTMDWVERSRIRKVERKNLCISDRNSNSYLPVTGSPIYCKSDALDQSITETGLALTWEGQNGFEELRRYIKQGGDFCKDLSSILQERSEVETQYAKSLSKLSGKLLKASKDSVGSVNQAWQRAGTQMEVQSEVHRAFATALSEEVVKPLRQLVETQHRIRKSVESAVDKTGKSLAEWRSAESKSKKQSFMCARENEKLQDAMLDVRLGRSGSTHHLHHIQNQKTVSEKESVKLESKRRKAEEAVKKADVEYYTFCIRAERARLEWETAVIRGSHCFQALEEERLQHLKDLASCYLQHLTEMGPKLVQSVERLSEPVQICDVARDIQTVVSIKGTGQPIPEQLLPDFYAEHITLAMNRDRRRQALVKLLQLIRQDLDRERRGKQGVENLARALQQTPTFGAEDSQQNVTEKLHHMRSMLTYLEAARYKVQSALAELDGRSRGSHPLASHIQVTRDRQGLQQSVLKVPPWVRKESLDLLAGDSPDWTDRGAADGNSVQPDSDFDEFSSQGSEKDYQSSMLTFPVISECGESNGSGAGRCKVLYEYSANLYDELNLSPGDVINIHDKQADGWWLGELNGIVGIFPATYVEEIK
uniref:(California timema) hypothetical protein n=1 Tax=Timema californicum TaxID=61474 RepID=A0A7R9IV62_TIMCA|nr:unnamed protein product [Timema californicum]